MSANYTTNTLLQQHGQHLLDAGYEIVPIVAGLKHPNCPNWQRMKPDVEQWASEEKYTGAGVKTKRTPAVDVDIRNKTINKKMVKFVQALLGNTVIRIGDAPKSLLFYRTDTPFKKLTSNLYESKDGDEHRIEILANGQQAVAYHIHPDTEQPYYYPESELTDVPVSDLPTITAEQAVEIIEYFESIVPKSWTCISPGSGRGQLNTKKGTAENLPEWTALSGEDKDEELGKMLTVLVGDHCDDRDSWKDIVAACKRSGAPNAKTICRQWSETSKEKFDEVSFSSVWSSYGEASAGDIMIGTLIHAAKQEGYMEPWNPDNWEALAKASEGLPTEVSELFQKEGEGNLDGKAKRTRGLSLLVEEYSSIVEKPISWLWEGKIAFGKLTIAGGNAGLNKSTIMLEISAALTRGRNWPDGTTCKTGGVIIMSSEDDAADTIKPRLRNAGADMSKVQNMSFAAGKNGEKVAFSFIHHLKLLDEHLQKNPQVQLIIVDPMTAFFSGLVNPNDAGDVRTALAPVIDVLARHEVAMLGLMHLNKNEGASAGARFSGSGAWVQVARSVWFIDRDHDNENRRVFLPVKNNLGRDDCGHSFDVAIVDGHPQVSWCPNPVYMTADQHLGITAKRKKAKKLDSAVHWLEMLLIPGPMLTSELSEKAEEHGICDSTLKRARKDLKVQSRKRKGDFTGAWECYLPEDHFPQVELKGDYFPSV